MDPAGASGPRSTTIQAHVHTWGLFEPVQMCVGGLSEGVRVPGEHQEHQEATLNTVVLIN